MQTKTQLFKTLYKAARYCVAPGFREDGEAIRTKRDAIVAEMYGTDYKQLTERQLVNVINKLQVQSGYIPAGSVAEDIASPKQVKLLRFYAFSCALHLMSYDDVEITNEFTGEKMSGYDLKFNALHLFEKRNGFIPPPLFRIIHKNYINPISHKYLIEGGFKKYAKNKDRFYFERLTPEEAQCLINRFREMFANISETFLPGDIQEIINAN